MTHVSIIGIGTGNPDHLSIQGLGALANAEAILSMDKASRGLEGANILDSVREYIIGRHCRPDITHLSVPDPKREENPADYQKAVKEWHDKRRTAIAEAIAPYEHVAYLAWGDPCLYDSAIRIFSTIPGVTISVVPGITAIQALCAAHQIPLNRVGQSVSITTARKLREVKSPLETDTIVMLDGENSWLSPAAAECEIYWGAYIGMKEEVLFHGMVQEVGEEIAKTKAALREKHGWIMDIYLLRV